MLPTRRFNEEDGVSWDQKIASLIDARVLQLKHYATRHQDTTTSKREQQHRGARICKLLLPSTLDIAHV